MALIKCIECKGKMSDQAESCPHCGAPAKLSIIKDESITSVPQPEPAETVDSREAKSEKSQPITERIIEKERVVIVHPPKKKKSFLRKFFIWLFVLIILAVIGILSYDFYMKNSGLENRVNYEIQKHRIKNNDGIVDRVIENHEERVETRQTRREARRNKRKKLWN